MRRPHEMRLIGLSRRDYQLIGEIAVISGLLEQEMKELIVRLVQAPWPDGIALTAHLNFGSLCDMASALIDSCLPVPSMANGWRQVISETRAAYNDRSELIHGPFSPMLAVEVGTKKGIYKTTARNKIKHRGAVASTDSIAETLANLCECHSLIFGIGALIEEQRAQATPELAHPRNRAGIPKANP